MNGKMPPKRKFCAGHKSKQKCRPKIIQECPIPRNLFQSSIQRETMSQLDLHNPAMCQWTSMPHDWEDPLPQKKENDCSKRTDVSTAETKDITRLNVGRNPTTSDKPTPLPLPQKKQTHSAPGPQLWNKSQLPHRPMVRRPPPASKSLPVSKTYLKTNIMTCSTR